MWKSPKPSWFWVKCLQFYKDEVIYSRGLLRTHSNCRPESRCLRLSMRIASELLYRDQSGTIWSLYPQAQYLLSVRLLLILKGATFHIIYGVCRILPWRVLASLSRARMQLAEVKLAGCVDSIWWLGAAMTIDCSASESTIRYSRRTGSWETISCLLLFQSRGHAVAFCTMVVIEMSLRADILFFIWITVS